MQMHDIQLDKVSRFLLNWRVENEDIDAHFYVQLIWEWRMGIRMYCLTPKGELYWQKVLVLHWWLLCLTRVWFIAGCKKTWLSPVVCSCMLPVISLPTSCLCYCCQKSMYVVNYLRLQTISWHLSTRFGDSNLIAGCLLYWGKLTHCITIHIRIDSCMHSLILYPVSTANCFCMLEKRWQLVETGNKAMYVYACDLSNIF